MSARRSSRVAPQEKPPAAAAHPSASRLQQVLAAAGLGSRRECEQLITDGRVTVDGQTATLGVRVDPGTQRIEVDGELLKIRSRKYYLVNKPVGVVSTTRDPAGRPRVIDMVPGEERLFTVGRLDMSSEGLMLVTNDGELANRLAHPRYGVEKTYRVTVAGIPDAQALNQLRRGIHLAEGKVTVSRLKVHGRHKQSTVLEMVLREGRNREIRRMAARIGHKVLALRRIRLGPLHLGTLPTGAWRPLSSAELRQLRTLTRPAKRPQAAPGQVGRRRSGGRSRPPRTRR